MTRALAVAALLASSSAWAYESVCRQYPDPSLEISQLANPSKCDPEYGPNTARQRWVGPLDEHRQLFERARRKSGLPDSLSATYHLRVYTSAYAVPVGPGMQTSLIPVPFQGALRVQTRSISPGELAQLPDWSFALWDWAMDHEVCPLEASNAAGDCHDFSTHMGAANSNHFLPQAQSFYARYHALALARARECQAMSAKLGAAAATFSAYALACEEEALSIEAVGQHFLHDAFSTGHMWQRWGSPDLSDFPGATADERHDRAVLVALVSGLIHGSRGVLQKLPEWTTFDVNDAMCSPQPGVKYVQDGALIPGLGDDYLALLPDAPSDEPFVVQSLRLDECAASGVREVYLATAQAHGAAGVLAAPLAAVDPTGPECFAQRATNEAMALGAGIQLRIAGAQITLPLDSRTASWMVPKVARLEGGAEVSRHLRNEFRVSLQRVVSVARILGKTSPRGTELAEGRLGDLVGVLPNGAYALKSPIASYADPELPWPGSPSRPTVDRDRALALARLFHRAHAQDLCDQTTAADLDAIRAHAQDGTLDAMSRAAACDACREISVRHVRLGTDAGSYDTAREPLCHYLSTAPALLYQPASDPAAAAAAYCGC